MEQKHVLIVDDIPENIQILVDALKDTYAVMVATSGQKALELINKKDSIVDIVLLDIVMPDMDGYEVCTKIKENPHTEDIPIIFISVLDDTESILKGFKVGGVDYVSKPFNVKEVISRVNTHIKLKDEQKELALELESEKKLKEKQEILLLQREKLAAMGEMIGMIAHQWKQPLSTISLEAINIMTAQELDGEVDGEVLLDTMKRIVEDVQFMSDTINDFRTFYKADKEKEKLFLCDSVDHAVKLVGRSFIKREVELTIDKCGNTKEVIAYKNELIQVILNLFKNAIDAIDEKEIEKPKIDIRCTQTDKMQVLEVEDNAKGIPDDIKEKIFDAGFSTKDESKQSSGLGLYIGKLIIENHCNGKISVHDGKDGALFRVEIPLVD